MELPPVAQLPNASTEEIVRVLDLLFEPSTQLHSLAVDKLRQQTFGSYNDLIASIGILLTDLAHSSSTSDTDWLRAILGSHPRLGAKKVESAQSQAEQASFQAGDSSEAEALTELNAQYEALFPGLRYVTFVDGRPRPQIMEDMRFRIQRNDISSEQMDAIKAMCDIAADRARKLSSS